MGSQWYYEDSHSRFGFGPKLILTGRLEGSLFGRSVEIEAAGSQLVVRVRSLRTAWLVRGIASRELIEALRVRKLSLNLRIGSKFNLQLLPNPPSFVRWFVPAFREIVMKD